MRRAGKNGRLRAAIVAGLVASVATAMVVAVSSPADSGGRGWQHDDRGGKAKNVIFLHGDGMGPSHRELVRLATQGQDKELVMDQLRYAGLVHTDSADPEEAVTDSAAGATAFASGVRTFNGAIGVDEDEQAVPTLLERARAAGKSTGLVTTAQVTDASPAAFGAHVPDRAQQSEIARQYLESSKPDVILGGGEDRWLPPGEEGAYEDNPDKDPTEQSSSDRGNLIERAEDLGYEYVADREELRRSRARKLLGLFANEEMFEQRPEGEGDIYEPVVPLDEMTSKALGIVSRDRDGFFLFVEEEGIDEFAHNNNAEKVIATGEALDRTVDVALRFAAAHPGTLLVVAGDHETGGLAIENIDEEDESGDGVSAEDGPFGIAGSDLEFTVDWSTGSHTGESTPLTANGPGARALARVQKNTDVHDAILDAMRLGRDR
jgi:alkaline phosphatase